MEGASLKACAQKMSQYYFHHILLEQLQRAPRLKGREIDPTSQQKDYQRIYDYLQSITIVIFVMFVFELLVLLTTDRLIIQLEKLKY